MSADAVARFLASMTVDRDKWRDGIGYDLGALDDMTAEERDAIEARLLARAAPDWRDLEALARIGSPAARQALRAAVRHADPAVRAAALRHGGAVLGNGDRLFGIRRAIEDATFFNGLSEALEAIETFHPPQVEDLLLRGLLVREGEAAVHFAAMIFFLRGLAKEPFDWDHRPFFLRFAEDDRSQRHVAFRELCALIGRDPSPFLADARL